MTTSQVGILGLLAASCFVPAGGNAFAQAIARRSEPQGYAYYHHRPPVLKHQSGFLKDSITGGLQRMDNGEYDI
jgi:hypothetical protein